MSVPVTLLSLDETEYPLEAFREDTPSSEEEAFDVEPEELPEDFLQKLPAALQKRLVGGAPSGTDRSTNDYHVARRLLQTGHSPGQVLAVFLHDPSDWAIGQKTTEKGIGYAVRTIKQALAEEGDTKTPSTLVVLVEQLHWIDGKRKREVDPDYAFTGPCLRWLREKGMQFLRDIQTGNGYVFWQGRIISADRDDRDLKDFVYEQAGLTETTWDSRKLRESIAHEARTHGRDVLLHTWIAFDTAKCRGYILPNPRAGSVIKIGADTLEWCSNGMDGFLLRPSMLALAVAPNFETDKAEGLRTLVSVMRDQFACHKDAQQLLTCYTICILLREFAASDLIPILHVTGPSGGGKSWALKIITAWLYGRPMLLRATQASSYAISNSDPLLALDDYETLDTEWQGRLLTGATGLVRTKMASASLNTATLQEGTVTFALTSINPLPTDTLRRRAAVVEVDSTKYPTPGFNSTMAITRVQETRNATWSAVLRLLSEDVLPQMASGSARGNIDIVQRLIEVPENRSLAAYLTLMYLVGEALNRYVSGFLQESLEETTKIWAQVLKLQSQDEFVERDPLILAVDITFEELFKVGGDYSLLNGVDVRPVMTKGSLVGFEGTGTELHATFGSVIRNHGLRYEMTSPNAVGRRFQLSQRLLKHAGWIATPTKFGSRRGWRVVKESLTNGK